MPTINFKKGRVKEKVNPKVLSALSKAFGYKVDGVDDLDYEEYYNELREAVIRGKNSLSDSEMAILINERKRIRGADKAGSHFSEKKTTMSAADMKKGSSLAFAESSALAVYGNGVGKSPDSSEDATEEIDDKLDDILETLREEGKLEKDQAAAAKKKAEQEKRAKKEKNLERWKALKTTASKVVKPFRSIWDKIFGFLKTILFGSVLVKIVKWMGDPKNQGKIESIGRFLKDWWPVLLTAYLAFGNGLSKFIIGLGAKLVMWGATLLKTVIPALFKAIAAMGPWGWAALGTAAVVGGGMMLHNKNKNKEGGGEETGIPDVVPRDESYVHYGPDEGVGAGFTQKEENKKMGKMMEEKNFNKGGPVPGSGNTDTVPAMLTPGEFVMSKGAVQKYGENTLASMNAMGGGTNRPTLMRGYNEGGKAAPMSMEDLVAAAGPSLMQWMEQHNALIDSDPDALFGEHMRVEMDRDGNMPNFGKTVANMSEWAFNTGVEQLANNEAIDPDVKEALLKKMAWIRKETLENPNFKSDMAFRINKDIPGTAANRLYLRAQNDPNNIAIKAGISPEEVAKLWNRRGMSGGGLVSAFNGGGLVKIPGLIPGFAGGGGVELIGPAEGWGKGKAGSKKFSGAQLKGLLDSQKGIGTSTPVKKKPPVMNVVRKPVKVSQINPPVLPVRSEIVSATKVNQKVKQEQIDKNGGGSKIPNFDAEKYISIEKVATLGMTV